MRTLIVEADGASRGNPGAASYGALVRDAAGEVLAEVAGALGTASNNVAEYRGLIAGLEAAAAIDPAARVEVRMDSKLVVEQMSGRWQVKHPDLKPLADRARGVLPPEQVGYAWIPRSQNKHADRLANQALDAAAKGQVWQPRTPPPPAAAPTGASTSAATGAPTGASTGAASTDTASAKVAWSPDLGRPTRLLLLRHGVTPLTVQKRFAGIGDPELIDAGREQARRAAERLRNDERYGPIDVIVASPLRRATATAEAVAKAVGLDVLPEPGFLELDFGRLEGLSFAEANDQYPAELAAFLGSPDVAPPGGETVTALARRVGEARDRMLARYPRQTVLVATHVTPIKALVCQALGAPLTAVNRMELSPASLTVIDFYNDGLANVRCVNDVSHLG
ncbi:bifunctional RNase H/acid phosphatase [Actinospica sp.]|uniref:bifunctional RNase H/acid phosphatase n=1 Tax=Actinospica sp. TaxID=1872142 RepID=UPI002B6B758C|nr:bifunctional RNase H/acid phosphatase [Actinospica sp.]HWG26941.1 bifunctional RNase H/acid phosphatase [Actinospica sp.]